MNKAAVIESCRQNRSMQASIYNIDFTGEVLRLTLPQMELKADEQRGFCHSRPLDRTYHNLYPQSFDSIRTTIHTSNFVHRHLDHTVIPHLDRLHTHTLAPCTVSNSIFTNQHLPSTMAHFAYHQGRSQSNKALNSPSP